MYVIQAPTKSKHPNTTLQHFSLSTFSSNLPNLLTVHNFSYFLIVYFLLIGILQLIPQITISQGKPTMFVPLTLVVIVSMIKDLLQDWKRHKSDKKQNNSEVQIITEIGVLKRKWESIKVGEIIRVKRQQYFPCDVLLLKHSAESKIAYIQTKNLDGQSNLKLKKIPDPLTNIAFDNQLICSNLRYQVNYQKPNPFLNVFNGNIKVNNKKYMLDNNNVILRGCSLKINQYVIGMCLYNGHQTKILLNSANPKPKRSYIQTYLNSYFKYIFVFQLCVTLLSAIIYGILLGLNNKSYTYFNQGNLYFVDTIFTWGSWFISFSNFIPISLLVTVEFVRYGQGKILEKDQLCKSKEFFTEVQTSSVNDDLGQIEYILSDKTGTLTKNQMDFKFLYVDGVSYGENQLLRFDILGDHTNTNNSKQLKSLFYEQAIQPHQQQQDLQQSIQDYYHNNDKISNPLVVQQLQSHKNIKQQTLLDKNQPITMDVNLNNKGNSNSKGKDYVTYNHNNQNKLKKEIKKIYDQLKQQSKTRITNVDFPQQQKQKILQSLSSSKNSQNSRQSLKLSLVHLALCHNVICQQQDYTSSSPDQVALVSFARYVGYRYIGKNDNNEIQIEEKIPGLKIKILRYQLLHVLEFSSERKRMSVLVKEICGAEEQKKQQNLLISQVIQHKSNNFEKTSSRILLLCKGADDVILKRISKTNDLFSDTKQKQIQNQLFNYACKGLRTLVLAYKTILPSEYQQWNSRYSETLTIVSNTRYEKVCDLQSEIENDMNFVAITAIEDKLQDQVKQTISQLKKSGIKVWMLTGDKKETAISIGYSCGLIDPTNQIITLDCEAQHAKPLILNVMKLLPLIKQQKVTVLSGQFLTGLTDGQAKQMLSQILQQSSSVICCRVSPKGKQQITSIVKKWGRTLAIGDGANDVNMINSAHIGVGVRGIQGSQATRAADYVISQFKILKRLVLYYGLNFYHRNCGVMLFTLYKNIFVTFPILFYGPLSIQSAVFIYEMWIFQFFNIFFASLPIIYFGLFDTLYTQKQILKHPYLYAQGQSSCYFNRHILVKQIFTTIISVVFLVFTSFFITNYTVLSNGLVGYFNFNSMLIFNVIIINVNIRIINMSNQINLFQSLLCLFGIGTYYLMFFLIQILFYSDIKNTMQHQINTWIYWLLVVLYVVAIEGTHYLLMRIKYVTTKLEMFVKEKRFEQELEMVEIKHNVNIEQISVQKKQSLGGYAYAEDQQRSLHFV